MDFNPEVLSTFAFWASILMLKVLVMVPLTGRQRFRKKVFANVEDTLFDKSNKAKVKYDDPDVERVRRAHLNDLENCIPWLIMTVIWMLTNPNVYLAKILIRTFVLARIGHTISYAMLAQQPIRAITFFVGFLITGYEALATMYYFL